jgi:hypothetical protein
MFFLVLAEKYKTKILENKMTKYSETQRQNKYIMWKITRLRNSLVISQQLGL